MNNITLSGNAQLQVLLQKTAKRSAKDGLLEYSR